MSSPLRKSLQEDSEGGKPHSQQMVEPNKFSNKEATSKGTFDCDHGEVIIEANREHESSPPTKLLRNRLTDDAPEIEIAHADIDT